MDAHIILGYGAMIGVSSGIITGWFRHKNQYVQTCMFYVHALSGYLGWGLASKLANIYKTKDAALHTDKLFNITCFAVANSW